MKYNKIVLAGGNGYLGRVFTEYYSDKAREIVILSRKEKFAEKNVRTVVWDGKTRGRWTAELVNADLLINLCGKNVNCRYTDKNKAEILASRIIPTELLGEVIQDLKEPPKVWINITSATIYRHAEDRPQDEENGEHGEGFSVDICEAWEYAFNKFDTPRTRKIALRMGMVLGASDSVFPRLRNLVKIGWGGRQGNGQQYISWVHELDAARSTEWLADHAELSGVFNCTAPQPVQNRVFMKTMRDIYHIGIGLPLPEWFLEIGAAVIGTETELILKSRWVLPKRLLDSGFKFKFNSADDAIRNIAGREQACEGPLRTVLREPQHDIHRSAS
jgi:uncharacterized protein (TIGR01777 family)